MTAVKKVVFVSIVFSIVFSIGMITGRTCYGEEAKVNYKSVAYNFYKMDFIDPLTGWICGKSGYMYHTCDGGMKWKRLHTDTVKSLFGIAFFDQKHGVVVGESGLIMKTEDGGLHWARVTSPTKKSLLTLDFYDADNGMAAGDWGKIIITDDGGKSWRDISLKEDILLYKLKYIGPKEVWIAAEMGNIFHTTDGGMTWEKKQLADGTLFGFEMNKDGYGIAVGVEGTVLKTTDGGKTWERQQISKDSLYAVKMHGEVAIAIGDAGKIYELNFKRDTTWRKIDVPNELRANWLHCIEGLENEKFIIAGARGSISFIEDGRLHRPES